MKQLKKVAALTIAFIMMMSLFSVGVFADGEKVLTATTEVSANGVGIGDSYYVSFYLSGEEDTITVRNLNFEIPYDPAKIKVEKVEGITSVKPSTKNGVVKFLYADTDGVGTGLTATSVAVKVKITILDGAVVGEKIAFAPTVVKYALPGDSTNYNDVTVSAETVVEVVEKYTVESADAIDAGGDFQYGTSAAEIEAFLNEGTKQVTATVKAVSTGVTSQRELTVQDWTAAEGYDPMSGEAQTFTATLVVDGEITTNPNNVVATALVTLKPITSAEIITDIPAELIAIKKKAGEAAYTADELVQAVKDAIGASITVKNGDITDVYEDYTVVVDGDLNVTNTGDTTKIKVSIAGESKEKIFDLSTMERTVNVVIRPNYGDVDGDEAVGTFDDLAIVLNYYLELTDLEEGTDAFVAADVNADGIVDYDDLAEFLNYYLELIDKFPAEL